MLIYREYFAVIAAQYLINPVAEEYPPVKVNAIYLLDTHHLIAYHRNLHNMIPFSPGFVLGIR